MHNKKLTNVLISIWGVTTTLFFIGLIVQMALPKILKNSKYMEMLFDTKQSIIFVIISFIVTYLLLFVFKTNVLSNYANKIKKEKLMMMLVTIFSIIFCLLFVLLDYSTIAKGIVASNNVKTLDGKVEKIQSKTLSKSDEIVTMVTVVDSNGEKHKMLPKRDVNLISVFKDSKVHLDYVDSKSMSSKYNTDGTILGYETVASDEKKASVDGILNQ